MQKPPLVRALAGPCIDCAGDRDTCTIFSILSIPEKVKIMVSKFRTAFKSLTMVLLTLLVLSDSTAFAGPPVTSLGRWVEDHNARLSFRCDIQPPYSTYCQRTVVVDGIPFLWTYQQLSNGFAAYGQRLYRP
jgi:hypothetical protein